ncbi:MAG: endopeptidase La [Candidatus Kapabacteria bacterium]|nr:endopeptidase La [Ignavibacteriota bacterium]MCW5885439.1 endopeptidase La [Candidatus Kapabacteria bacterium]
MAKKEDLLSGFEPYETTILNIPKTLPVLPVRDIVLYPYMIFPLLIGRSSTLKAVGAGVEKDKYIFVTAQKNSEVEEPNFNDLYEWGTVARIIQVLRLPNNLLKVLVEGLFQAKIKKKLKNKDYLEAELIIKPQPEFGKIDKELQANINLSRKLFVDYVKNDPSLPDDLIAAFDNYSDLYQRLFFAAANVRSEVEKKQPIIETTIIEKQYFLLSSLLKSEIEMQNMQVEIGSKINEQINKTQRRYFIQEQIRILQNELGDGEDSGSSELNQIKEAIDNAGMPEHAFKKAMEEFERLKKTPSMSPEFSVNRNFIEMLTQIPWKKATTDILDINHVKKILDEDHFDLEKPKERILEFIAILNLAGKLKRQILCFVGPPGVGKTSLAKSIARALGREFVRFSLGGVRDEAEIRGHRRTYIGAMPGKIIQSMKKAGTVNPVILLDEIDKMSMDFRGDPSSALLEVLDPEQNANFNDHYLEVDYDLSNVMFITTANVRYDIPLPLLDRMEIIELTSYLDPEKLQIAKKHILPKLLEEFGLNKLKIDFQDESITKIIREYTREAGVRSLEREIASVLRKLTKDIVADYFSSESLKKANENLGDEKQQELAKSMLKDNPAFLRKVKRIRYDITPDIVEKYLKSPRFKEKQKKLDDKVGVVNGLAWTSVGGDIMPIEVTIMPGNEKLTLTGKLGDVMKESAMAALSFIRSNYNNFGLNADFSKKSEIHLHVPEGAIPKDGPSAGITMAIAIISASTGVKVRGDVAMTGEITLRGDILAIGGLKEKLLAAKRSGMNDVLVPKENFGDVADISDDIKSGLKIHFVEHLNEAIEIAFRDFPKRKDVVRMKQGDKN